MTEAKDPVMVVKEQIIQKIVHLRGQKVILDIMLSSVLKSHTAIEINIAIMRTFVALRKVSYNYKEIMEILMDM